MEVDVVTLAAEFPNDNPALHRGTIWTCHVLTGPAVAERARAAVDEDLALVEADEPILIEELEPIEACVEGEAQTTAHASETLEALAVIATAVEGTVEPLEVEPLEVEPLEVELCEAEADSPVPARVSEVVLAGTHLDRDDDCVSPDIPSVFDDVPSAVMTAPSIAPPPADDPFTTLVCKLVDVVVSSGSLDVAAVLPDLLGNGRVSAEIGREVAAALHAAGYWDGTDVAPSFVRVAHAWRDILRGTSEDFDACGGASLDEWAADVLAKLLAAPARLPLLRQELRSRGVAAFGLVEAA